jgi:hypothetical protein
MLRLLIKNCHLSIRFLDFYTVQFKQNTCLALKLGLSLGLVFLFLLKICKSIQ